MQIMQRHDDDYHKEKDFSHTGCILLDAWLPEHITEVRLANDGHET